MFVFFVLFKSYQWELVEFEKKLIGERRNLNRKASQKGFQRWIVSGRIIGTQEGRNMWTHYLDRRELLWAKDWWENENEFLSADPEGICCIFDEHSLFPHLMENSRKQRISIKPDKTSEVTHVLQLVEMATSCFTTESTGTSKIYFLIGFG